MSSKDKKAKKPHNNHHHSKGVVPPPKKSKNKKDKKVKKEKSSSKAQTCASNASLRSQDIKTRNRKEELSTDGGPLLPSINGSDTCVSTFVEQPGGPSKTGSSTKQKEKAIPPGSASPSTPTAPSTPTGLPACQTAAKSPWKGEEVALCYIGKFDGATARMEYTEACAGSVVNVERDCILWKKNLYKNQSDSYPIIDSNIVKIPNHPEDYVNMSSILVPHCRYPVLMGQMPKRGFEEEFWKATFYESVVMMYVLMGKEDERNDFFPSSAGAYVYYGSMFVNIRKVEKMDEERTRYTIEVLPNGLSNSLMVNVYVHSGWEPFGVPIKFANTTRSVVDVMNFVKTSNGTEKMLVVSRNGCGRAGYFLALGAAFCCLNDNSEPRLMEIVKSIRLQRPHAVDSMKQYASLYMCILYYIKKKVSIPEGMRQRIEDATKSFEILMREDLSILY